MIRTTGQARRARRHARLALIARHDWTLHIIRRRLADVGWDDKAELAAAALHHLDRMEHHLDMIEAGQ